MDNLSKMFDPLKSYDNLIASGCEDKQARAVVATVRQSSDDAFNNLATKEDLKLLEVKTQADLKQVEAHLRQDIVKVESKLELLMKVNVAIFITMAANILLFWLHH